MSKVEGGGGPIDPPSRLRVTIFSRRLLGLTDPSCTDQACIWNKSFKEINPRRVKDINFQAHKRHNPDPKFTLNNAAKQEFDPRPAIHQTT